MNNQKTNKLRRHRNQIGTAAASKHAPGGAEDRVRRERSYGSAIAERGRGKISG